MLDIEKCKNRFLEYVKEYDCTNDLISLKVVHTLGVASYSEIIAKSLGLDEDKVKLAYIIGILHDIGRFEQVRITNTYSDRGGINHTDMGIKILFEDNMITEFIDTREYDETIKHAISNHSLFKINDGLNDETLMFAKIIRDADKLDIFKVFKNNDVIQVGIDSGFKDTDEYSKDVLDAFYKGYQLDRSHLIYLFDWYINMIAFTYDLYYKKSFELVKEEKFFDIIFESMKEKKKHNDDLNIILDDMKLFIDKYLENKING